MRNVKKAIFSLFAALVALVLVATPALAEDYTYTVRLFAGNHGTVGGSDVMTLGSDYVEGDVVTLSRDMVEVEEGSKYYVKGFRISGQDDLVSAVTVSGDTDVVVAYGVEGKMVSYTVHFVVEATGVELGSATFTGKVGDKPVESYEYFEGYRPLYRNITGTLVDGANDWTLPYVAETVTETVVTETVETTTEAAAAPAAAAAEGAAAAAAPAAAEGAAAPAAEGAAAPAATPEATAPATEEILDVDNPLAGPDGQGTEGQGGQGANGQGQSGSNGQSSENIGENENPTAGAASIVGNNWIVILLVAALGTGAFLLLRRKGDGEESGR